jgi:hypothetical protein
MTNSEGIDRLYEEIYKTVIGLAQEKEVNKRMAIAGTVGVALDELKLAMQFLKERDERIKSELERLSILEIYDDITTRTIESNALNWRGDR